MDVNDPRSWLVLLPLALFAPFALRSFSRRYGGRSVTTARRTPHDPAASTTSETGETGEAGEQQLRGGADPSVEQSDDGAQL